MAAAATATAAAACLWHVRPNGTLTTGSRLSGSWVLYQRAKLASATPQAAQGLRRSRLAIAGAASAGAPALARVIEYQRSGFALQSRLARCNAWPTRQCGAPIGGSLCRGPALSRHPFLFSTPPRNPRKCRTRAGSARFGMRPWERQAAVMASAARPSSSSASWVVSPGTWTTRSSGRVSDPAGVPCAASPAASGALFAGPATHQPPIITCPQLSRNSTPSTPS